MFDLPYRFAVPDVLFDQELKDHHAHLLQLGLESKTLSSEIVSQAYELRQQHSRPSVNDLLALSLAKYENCQLLTGDKDLRKVAEAYLVDVHGTIWLVEKMIQHQKITTETAAIAYQKMKNCGRRLPWGKVKEKVLIEINIKLSLCCFWRPLQSFRPIPNGFFGHRFFA